MRQPGFGQWGSIPLTDWDASHYDAPNMSQQTELLSEIEAFLVDGKMAETTFGRFAVNDGKFVARLRSGGNLTVATIDKVREYIRGKTASERSAA